MKESHFQVPNSILVTCGYIKTTSKLGGIKEQSSYYAHWIRDSDRTNKDALSLLHNIWGLSWENSNDWGRDSSGGCLLDMY